jgi:peptide/nickel transport system permease protein
LIRYLIRRVLFAVLVLWIMSVITFVIFIKLPASDPAYRAAGRAATAATIAAARHAFGLDKPWYVQYARFAKGFIPLPGFFLNRQVYFSYGDFIPVKEEIYSRLPITLTVAIGATAVWLLLGIPIGIVSAIRPRTVVDRLGMLFALLGVSSPDFWLAYLFLFLFWFKLHWLPGSGIPVNENVYEAILHGRFILPWAVLSSTFAAFYTRMIRGSLIETMSEDYIRTARAKGLAERRVIFKHGMRGALTPVVTMLGIDFGELLGGAVITETVFNLHGVGQYAINSIFTNDFPAVMAVTIVASIFIVVMNVIVDVSYAFLDPRVRYN